jgi:hypothetical protein
MSRRGEALSRLVDEGWLSMQEAADRCGMAYRTTLGMVRRGELPA